MLNWIEFHFIFSQRVINSLSCWDLNPGPPREQAAMLVFELWWLSIFFFILSFFHSILLTFFLSSFLSSKNWWLYFCEKTNDNFVFLFKLLSISIVFQNYFCNERVFCMLQLLAPVYILFFLRPAFYNG